MKENWKSYISGIDRLFVAIWSCSLHVLWKRGDKIGPQKYIVTKEFALESIAQFLQKHSKDNHDLTECRKDAEFIWNEIDNKRDIL